MYLFIDPAERTEFVLYLAQNKTGEWNKITFPRTEQLSLLGAIIKVLEEAGATLRQLEGLGVRLGQGSFTSDRIAVTTINMLVFTLKIPVCTGELADLPTIRERLAKLEPHYLTARYSSPPNVGNQEPYLR